MNRCTRRRRSALFAFLFLLFAAGAVCGWMCQVLRSDWRRLFIRSVELDNRMEKRLKISLEPLSFTSQGYVATSMDSEVTSLAVKITTLYIFYITQYIKTT